MCARYSLTASAQALFDLFQIPEFEAESRWDIAPTDVAPIVVLGTDGSRQILKASWGFRPSWNIISTKLLINVQSETARTRASFKKAFETRRCLVPASGFYEWRDGRRYIFRRADRKPFAIAGIYEVDQDSPKKDVTLAVVTAAPELPVSLVHDRRPVLIGPECFESWLSAKTPHPEVQNLCQIMPIKLQLQEVDKRRPELDIQSSGHEIGKPSQLGLF